jgi:pyrophosphatase PpaX
MFGPSETGIIRNNLCNANKEQAIEMYYEKCLANHTQFVQRNQEIDELLLYLIDKANL